jgi:hypothetical protein
LIGALWNSDVALLIREPHSKFQPFLQKLKIRKCWPVSPSTWTSRKQKLLDIVRVEEDFIIIFATSMNQSHCENPYNTVVNGKMLLL